MFFMKRALLYVRRKWGKALTVGIILFIVSTLVLTGLLIKSAAQSTFEVARNKLGATVVYTTNLSSAMKEARSDSDISATRGTGFSFSMPDDYTSITTKEIELITLNSKYVKSYTISATQAVNAVDFTYYDPSGSDSEDKTESSDRPYMGSNADMNIVGVDVKDKQSTFESDYGKITSGRYFTDDEVSNASNVIIIENTIADLNDIAIGDTITIERVDKKGPSKDNEVSDDTDEETVEISYEVVGIYETTEPTDVTTSGFMGSYNLNENTMYAPYTTVLAADLAGLTDTELTEAKDKITENGYEVKNVIFTLNDADNIDSFIEEVENMGDIDMTYRSLSADNAAYEQMVGPIENVASTSVILVIVVVIAGAFIIGLLSMLSIKDRKYELGVLLSLGESRIRIVAQLIGEMLIIAVLSFGLAAIVSNFTAQATTNFLLNQEIASSTEEIITSERGDFSKDNMMGGMQKPNSTQLSTVDVDTIDTLTVSVSFTDIAKMFGIGIIIIILGNVIQAAFVLRCNPKEILLER
ncbi:MAG: ABC transporter permease [Bacilli bacterium]